MGFDHTDHRVHTLRPLRAAAEQHLEGLADARGGPQENLQLTPLIAFGLRQQRIRRRASLPMI
jgi:hypothetical protein